MSNYATATFMSKVPRTPLSQHIEALHSMAHYAGVYGSAMEMFEHHLMSVAVFTSVHDPIREGIRREVEAEVRQEFLETTPMVTPEAMKRAFEGMAQSPKTSSEAYRERQFKRNIENERKLGLAYVRAEARRVRRELGL